MSLKNNHMHSNYKCINEYNDHVSTPMPMVRYKNFDLVAHAKPCQPELCVLNVKMIYRHNITKLKGYSQILIHGMKQTVKHIFFVQNNTCIPVTS